ncbi:hypothetical protein QUA41_17795 [Microcoleus sp. Pol11C1]|uniref:hypothetical protein n=1 Tax=unclassified Microcoleus TaxID=2642155 RepID=UPI002FD4CAC1
MIIQPDKPIPLPQPYRIPLTTKSIELQCCLEVAADSDDEWIIPTPIYAIGQKVWPIAPDLPVEDWEEKRIFGIELYAPRWQHGSLMAEPIWYYGVKALTGQGETKWLTEDKITQTPQACDFESDYF